MSATPRKKRRREGLRLGPLWFHRKEQWDLECQPWLCVHLYYDQGNGSRRVACLWPGGLDIGRLAVRWWLR